MYYIYLKISKLPLFYFSLSIFLLLGRFVVIAQPNTTEPFLPLLSAAQETPQDYSKAILQSSQRLKQAKLDNDVRAKFEAYAQLSKGYKFLRDTAIAISYAKKALNMAAKLDNDTLLCASFKNLGGLLCYDNSTCAQGTDLLQKALLLAKSLNADEAPSIYIELIAGLYRQESFEEMKRSLDELRSLLQKPKFSENQEALVNELIYRGKYYKHTEDLIAQEAIYKKAYTLIEAKQLRSLAVSFYPEYYDLLKNNKQFPEALRVLENYITHHNILQNLKNNQALSLSQARAEADEYKLKLNQARWSKAMAEEKLSQRRVEDMFMGTLALILCFYFIHLLRSSRTKRKLINDLEEKNLALQNAKVEIEKSLTSKNNFFSALSHEIRTPLHGVTGIVALLEKNPKFSSHREELASLKFSSEHLLEIVNDLLDISSLENPKFKLKNKPFDIQLLANELLISLRQYNVKNNNQLYLELSPAIPQYLNGDSGRLSQILINLLSNSIKFTRGGTVQLRLLLTAETDKTVNIQFEVRDNGVGIPKEMQSKIFNEFEQLNTKNSKLYSGTGLGLCIVKKLLDKMNSKIILESEPSKGTSIQFNLQFKKVAFNEITHANKKNYNTQEAYYESFEGSRILIVDDNKINRMITSKLLKEKSIITDEAQNGEQAIQMVGQQTYDLILMDINMPGMNGFETAEVINEKEPNLPIVALTASDAGYLNEKLKTSCMKGAIIKPYDTTNFLETIFFHIAENRSSISA